MSPKKAPDTKPKAPRSVKPAQESAGMALVFDRRRADPLVGYFARKEDYEHVTAIEQALATARTWGELRQLMPPGEFETLLNWWKNDGEYVYHDGGTFLFGPADYPDPTNDDFDDLYVIDDTDPLSKHPVVGVDSGDYPPFLEPDQDLFLPEEFCRTFGTWETGYTSGGWHEFPLDRFNEMRDWLEARGFSVIDRRS